MSLTRSLPLPSLVCAEERREQGGKNNAEIMRISKKFLGGVFNFNHHDYPSSVALIPPPLCCPVSPPGVWKWRWTASTWSDSACKGHTDKVQMWCLTQAFSESSQGGAQDSGQGLRVCRSPGHTIFPFPLASPLRLKPQQCTWEGNLLSWVLSSLDKKLGAENWMSHFWGRDVFSLF